MAIDTRARPAVVGCALLAAVTVAGCGTVVPTFQPPATATSDAPMIAQWIGMYCTQMSANGDYAQHFADPTQPVTPLNQVDAEITVQTTSTLASATRAILGGNIAEVKGDRPTTTAGRNARTFLLNAYQNLSKALDTAESQLSTIPTADPQQFGAAYGSITGSVSLVAQQTQDTIDSYPAFVAPLRNYPGCK